VKQSVEDKAQAYLLADKVAIVQASEHFVLAEVQGTSVDPYAVTWNGVAWDCDCPAYINRCAHVLAVRKVVGERQPIVQLDMPPSEVDALFT